MPHPKPTLTLTLIASLLTATAAFTAPNETELAKKAQSDGEFETLTSTDKDPVGKAGLWGFKAKVMVPNSCQEAFAALRDVESYPKRMEKVKRVIVLERKANTLLADYTEGGIGIEMRTTVLWRFQNQPPMSILSENVGPDDPKTWMQTHLVEVGHPGYCELNIRLFADMSIMPNFVMVWITDITVEETAKAFRKLIAESVAEKQSVMPQKD